MSKINFFTKIKNSILNTKKKIKFKISNIISHKQTKEKLLEYLEEQLIIADIGIETIQKIIEKIKIYLNLNYDIKINDLYYQLKKEMILLLNKIDKPLILTNIKPLIIFMTGVNGVGKTTAVAKLAYKYKKEKKKILLVAGDNFRAAAIEQIKFFGKEINIPVINGKINSNVTPIINYSLNTAKKNNIDIVIIDTAGRLQNKIHLMDELKKIVSIIKQDNNEVLIEIFIVLDANIGQNNINQIQIFNEILNLTGIIITKLNNDTKGGFIFTIADNFNIPIRYITASEYINDLQIFKPEYFVNNFLFKTVKFDKKYIN